MAGVEGAVNLWMTYSLQVTQTPPDPHTSEYWNGYYSQLNFQHTC